MAGSELRAGAAESMQVYATGGLTCARLDQEFETSDMVNSFAGSGRANAPTGKELWAGQANAQTNKASQPVPVPQLAA